MVTNLTAIQRRNGWSDREMAERLGIDRSYWTHIRLGRMDLSHTLALRAAGLWPELTRDLLELAVSVSTSTNTATEAA